MERSGRFGAQGKRWQRRHGPCVVCGGTRGAKYTGCQPCVAAVVKSMNLLAKGLRWNS